MKELSTVAMENEPEPEMKFPRSQKNNYIQRQPVGNTEDGTAPIRYSILSLVGLFGVLVVLYNASYTIKRHRRQGAVIDMDNIQMKSYGTKEGLEIG